MTLKLVAYKDTKLNIFTHPIFFDGDRKNEEIIELFRRMCVDPELPLTYFDYDIYELGSFDDKTGQFETHDPEFLVSLADYKYLRPVTDKKEVTEDVSQS